MGKALEKLPACCLDMDIDLVDLIFPERMSVEGREFCDTHGIRYMSLAEIMSNSMWLGNGKIKLRHRCLQLADDGTCLIYEHRPQICRDFDCSTRSDCRCNGSGVIQIVE